MLSTVPALSPPLHTEPSSSPPVSLESAMRDVLSVESAFAAKFLPYMAMTQLPRGFQDFAQWHFRRLNDDSLNWRDAAPAYALACLSHAAYGSVLDPSVEWELELQWSDLRRLSRLSWFSARPLIMAAWTFLSSNDVLATGDDPVIEARLAYHGANAGLPDPSGEEGDLPGAWLESELVPAYAVLRESMAQRSPEAWRTRGQERWLSADVPAICLALSPALAALEAVTWQGFLEDEPRYLVRLAFPPSLLRELETMTEGGWREGEASKDIRRSERPRPADRWARDRSSALLQVPSPLCPGEFNVLANLAHPDFAQLQRIDARPLKIDRRQGRH